MCTPVIPAVSYLLLGLQDVQWAVGNSRGARKLARTPHVNQKKKIKNHLGGGPMVRAWDQEVYSLCGLRFEPCGCSYDDHWRLTWSLTSRAVGLVEVRAS